MQKEYRFIFFKSTAFQILAVMSILDMYILYITIRENIHPGGFLTFTAIILALAAFSFFYLAKLTVYLDDDAVTVKLPDKITKVPFRSIYKIEKILGWGGFGYYIFYKDEKDKKRTTGIPNDLENYREVIDYISKKSGVQVKLGL